MDFLLVVVVVLVLFVGFVVIGFVLFGSGFKLGVVVAGVCVA